MKRILLTLFVFVVVATEAFATFTEFYTQSGGSNLNACSTTGAAVYTGTGSWVQSTGVFTPTDNSTPASTVSVGMWGSVYVTSGATETVWIARISVVNSGTNGTVTINTNGIGAKPSNGTGTITLKVGGACAGPNAASGFPLSLANWGNNEDSTNHRARLNLKNDQTYTMTSSFAVGAGGSTASTIQGYTTNPGDGGRATFDGTTNTGAIISSLAITGTTLADCVFTTSITTGTTVDLVVTGAASVRVIGCVFTGARRYGLNLSGGIGSQVFECEAYTNNVNNNNPGAGFGITNAGGAWFYHCISHDNAGSNTAGFYLLAANAVLQNCVADTNGHFGAASGASGVNLSALNCDFYNNGSDGINITSAGTNGNRIENCNFFKNTGLGINNASVINEGYVYNCTYGAGTQANGGSNTLNNFVETGATTYTSNLTPWVDPANGNFTQTPLAGIVGRGAFTTTASSYGPTVGYPFDGAAPPASPTPTATATATATFTPTPTVTPTSTPTPTATFGPNNLIYGQ